MRERSGNVPSVAHTRGRDLSGSLSGAGGIGDLLARSSGYSSGTGAWSAHDFRHADGNGNITAYPIALAGLSDQVQAANACLSSRIRRDLSIFEKPGRLRL